MSNANLVVTDEQREKSRLARIAKRAWSEENLQQEFLDVQIWRDLASKHSVRLPISYAAGTETKYYKRITKQLGVELEQFVEETGFKTIKQFAKANMRWPAYAICGLILEWFESLDGEKTRKEDNLQEN